MGGLVVVEHALSEAAEGRFPLASDSALATSGSLTANSIEELLVVSERALKEAESCISDSTP